MLAGNNIERVAGFVDGFNLYHAIHELRKPHLKWINLWKLVERFAAQKNQQLVNVFYFSAYATWLPDAYARHRKYVKALECVGVLPIMGRFKEKGRECKKCKIRWMAHEEKETDVNLALYLLNEARKNTYDHAFLVSNDSDLVPAVRMLKSEFPSKRVRIITPPGKRTSKDLVLAAGGFKFTRSIKPSHLSKALLPALIKAENGENIMVPSEYRDPAGLTR